MDHTDQSHFTSTDGTQDSADGSVAATLGARLRGDAGQTTAEYALVLVGVAAIAMLVLAWAGQTSRITTLFDAVLDSIIGLVP